MGHESKFKVVAILFLSFEIVTITVYFIVQLYLAGYCEKTDELEEAEEDIQYVGLIDKMEEKLKKDLHMDKDEKTDPKQKEREKRTSKLFQKST